MADAERAHDAEEEDEELKIFQAMESSRNQVHESRMKLQRESTIAYRAMMTSQPKQTPQQQESEKHRHKDAVASKPVAFAPKGIPTSMVVTQAQPEEGAMAARFASMPASLHVPATLPTGALVFAESYRCHVSCLS